MYWSITGMYPLFYPVDLTDIQASIEGCFAKVCPGTAAGRVLGRLGAMRENMMIAEMLYVQVPYTRRIDKCKLTYATMDVIYNM
jgi:hypothetical protein